MAVRLNIGCGDYPLSGFVNIDANAEVRPDVVASVPPLPYADGSVDEIYAGHFLEHLTREDGAAFLRECARCLVPGGLLGVLVPDTRAVMGAYLGQLPLTVEYPHGTVRDCRDLNEICAMFLYSTVQESRHQWSYDIDTLGRAMTEAGLRVTRQIDRFKDPRIPVGSWYQCGLNAVKEVA